MSTLTELAIQPPRVPFVDPQTGIITREWYRFIKDIFSRVGGSSTINLDALVTLFNALVVQVNGDEQSPPAAVAVVADDVSPPVVAFAAEDNPAPPAVSDLRFLDDLMQTPPTLSETVEFLQTEVRSLADQLAEAIAQINELKQGTLI